jgi:hypothetical protein
VDVVAAWSVVSHTGRGSFGGALHVDDDTWDRAHGLPLHQAAVIISAYPETSPRFVAKAKRTVQEIVADITA